jgi:hypothetical protein
MSVENQLLLKNANDQLLRLVQQLRDLEECRDDMTEEEFNESKEDTKEQLRFVIISLRPFLLFLPSLFPNLQAFH